MPIKSKPLGRGSISHLISADQLDKETLSKLFRRADKLSSMDSRRREKLLRGKRVGLLFYEPSTRTRWSFEDAVDLLGAKKKSSENASDFSSAVKGESLEDTVRVIAHYVDCAIIRHNESGSMARIAHISPIPLINAGDGNNEHPTQAALDLYTIQKEIGRLDDIKVAMVGDLRYGRTVRSLSKLLAERRDVEIVYVSPESLRISADIKGLLVQKRVKFREESDISGVLPSVDIVYMTRIQKERMGQEAFGSAEKYMDRYIINSRNFGLMRESSRLMHPLPKLGEIDLPVDVESTDQRVAYFRQAGYGVAIRMAILEHVLRE